jgi:hypothetical protein
MTEDRELCQRCRNECGHADLAARLATAERTINEQNKAHAEYVSALEADFREAERDLANLTLAYTDALGERDEARAALERLVNAPGYNESTENHNASRAARALLARGGQP